MNYWPGKMTLVRDIRKGDTIKLDGVFYYIIDRRPDDVKQNKARFQMRTVVGSVVQVDVPNEIMIEVV